MKILRVFLIACFFNLCIFNMASAGLSLSATRIVFNGNEKQASIRINNSSDQEGFFQVWLDLENEENADIPFAVIPPFAKISGKGSQELRIIAQGAKLPEDRETIYWLNVQEIPRVSSEYAQGQASGVSFTIRQRIKFFYRPVGVKTDAASATSQLEMKIFPNSKQSIFIKNPSGNFVTLINFKLTSSPEAPPIADVIMIPPLSEVTLSTSKALTDNATLFFDSMTDFGFPAPFSVRLSANSTLSPTARTNEP